MTSDADTSSLREVRGTFTRSDQMQEAVSQLGISGFDRAEISLPSTLPGASLGDNSAPATTGEDAQQIRTLGASTAATAAALAAVGVTVATGGAAAPAVAAAVLAGGAAGGATYAAQGSANRSEQKQRDSRAAEGSLVLTVRTTTEAKHTTAVEVMRRAGATDIVTVG